MHKSRLPTHKNIPDNIHHSCLWSSLPISCKTARAKSPSYQTNANASRPTQTPAKSINPTLSGSKHTVVLMAIGLSTKPCLHGDDILFLFFLHSIVWSSVRVLSLCSQRTRNRRGTKKSIQHDDTMFSISRSSSKGYKNTRSLFVSIIVDVRNSCTVQLLTGDYLERGKD